MHRIEIDDAVYAELERHVRGFEQPNDVLRRLLLKDDAPRADEPAKTYVWGGLYDLIVAGYLNPGDELTHHKPRKGLTFTGKVDGNGFIVTELGSYKDPSPALGQLVGTQIDGWAFWTHVRSGKTLRALREELRAKGFDV